MTKKIFGLTREHLWGSGGIFPVGNVWTGGRELQYVYEPMKVHLMKMFIYLKILFLKMLTFIFQPLSSWVLSCGLSPFSHHATSPTSPIISSSVLSAVSSCILVGKAELLSSFSSSPSSFFPSTPSAPLLLVLHDVRRTPLHLFLNDGSQAA